MPHPASLSIEDFSYELPEEKIARFPLDKRDASKLLIYQDGKIREDQYAQLATYLPSDSLLVFNDSKVIAARLVFQKPSGGNIEIFCLEPHEQYPDIPVALQTTGSVQWKCLIGGASKWKHGQILEKETGGITLTAVLVEKRKDSFVIGFSWTPASQSFAAVLQTAGAIPLPPYLRRAANEDDRLRYQTIYANQEGSVAAPTAGLHFTQELMERLLDKGIQRSTVTLHVGAGTFLPVKSPTLQDHPMHEEWITVSIETVQQLIQKIYDPIIAVGTTSLRSVESLYWIGVQVEANPRLSPDELYVNQWMPYDRQASHLSVKEMLQSLLLWMEKESLAAISFRSRLLIAPGYRFRIVRGLITNFHQPQSTLLLLVAALIGDDWKNVYSYALANDYRFLSYGDGCLFMT